MSHGLPEIPRHCRFGPARPVGPNARDRRERRECRYDADAAGEQPYRRKVVTFQQKLDTELGVNTVQLGNIKRDRSEFKTRFEPGNPNADARGFVQKPNVDTMMETLDLREAQRSYEANLNVITTTRRMLARTLEILRA